MKAEHSETLTVKVEDLTLEVKCRFIVDTDCEGEDRVRVYADEVKIVDPTWFDSTEQELSDALKAELIMQYVMFRRQG